MDILLNAVATLGLPTVLCGVLLWGIWRILNVAHKDIFLPIVESHKIFLEGTKQHLDSTSEAIGNIRDTLEKLEATMESLLAAKKESISVMQALRRMPENLIQEIQKHADKIGFSSLASELRSNDSGFQTSTTSK